VFDEFYEKYKNQTSQNKLKAKLKIIDFSNYDSFCLYYAMILGRFFCCKRQWKKHKKMIKTYEIGR
jgi:hypothetical protein